VSEILFFIFITFSRPKKEMSTGCGAMRGTKRQRSQGPVKCVKKKPAKIFRAVLNGQPPWVRELMARMARMAKGWPAGSNISRGLENPPVRSQENAEFNEKSFINMAMNLIKANNNASQPSHNTTAKNTGKKRWERSAKTKTTKKKKTTETGRKMSEH